SYHNDSGPSRGRGRPRVGGRDSTLTHGAVAITFRAEPSERIVPWRRARRNWRRPPLGPSSVPKVSEPSSQGGEATMPSHDRRAAARRRAWGRGPIILRFEPLEERQLLAANALPDLVGAAFDTSAHTLDWGDSFHATGQVRNQGNGPQSGPFNVAIYAATT